MKTALSLLAFAVAATAAPASRGPLDASAPLLGVKIPLFTAEGYRELLLTGDKAKRVNDDRFDVIQMYLTYFSGKADEKIDTIIISTQASFFPSKKMATGTNGVRIIQEGLGEMSGDTWTYWNDEKKVVIDGHVKVTFESKLKDILR